MGRGARRRPAPRTTCSTPGSNGWRWTRPAPPATAGASTARRSRCATRSARSPSSPRCPWVELEALFRDLELSGREAEIARDIVAELRSRLSFLDQVGLSYLSLDRSAPTLSGGEAQRIRLASQLGSNLRGVCYILDEPTIGLHPRDNKILLDTLEQLRRRATRWWWSSTTRTPSGAPRT